MRLPGEFRRRFTVARDVLRGLQSQFLAERIGRFIVADPAIVGNHGHHATECLYFIKEAENRGIATRVFAHTQVDALVQSSLGATPHFRSYTYNVADTDPICGWLTSFFNAVQLTLADLARLPDIKREDMLLVHGAQPAQLLAAAEWALTLPDDRFPLIIVELGGEPGVGLTRKSSGERGIVVPNPNVDARATLFRFAAKRMHRLRGKPFHVITYEPSISDLYGQLMEEPIGTLPFPTPAIVELRNRAASRPVKIAALGHQQPPKGFLLLPDIADKVLKLEKDVRILVHNSDSRLKFVTHTDMMKEAQEKLRAIAAKDPRLVLDEREVDFEEWRRMIADTDLMLCPYNPARYATAHSGLASAAIANGIPIVVPAETSLSRWLKEFDEPGTTFDKFETESVVAAVRRALRRFDLYAERAFAAAARWANHYGPANTFAQILRLNDARFGRTWPDPVQNPAGRSREDGVSI